MYDLLDKDIDIEEYLPVIKRSKLVSNYFYPNISKIQSGFNEKLNNEDLYKYYEMPFIVCLKDKSVFKDNYYEEKITEEQLNEIIDSIEIIPIKYKVLTGSLNKYLTSISAEIFNINFEVYDKYGKKYVANNNILICSLLRFKYSNIIRYLKQFDGLCNFIDIYNTLIINEYFGQFNNTSTIKNNLIIMINNMDESNYYINYNNCQICITSNFKFRNFNSRMSNKLLDDNIKEIFNNFDLPDNDNYSLYSLKKQDYIDPSISLKNNGYNIYKINNNILYEILSNEHYNNLFDKLDEKEKYYMLLNSMISKDLCHYVINNIYILKYINANMNKYAQIIRYTLGYAWITFYIEESIKKIYIKKLDRFIFNIDTASLLPWYPYSTLNLSICPYLPILVNNDIINANKNILGADQLIVYSEEYIEIFRYGITTKDTFINRFNKFVSGKHNMNLFENIDWSNIAISGSIMACCLPNFNTIMANHFTNNEIDFISFINEYYKEADIDVMCSINNIYDYIDKIHEIANIIKINIIKNYNLSENIHILNINSNKSVSIIINKDFIETNLVKELNINYSDIININDINIKKVIYNYYIKWFKENLEISLKDNYKKFIDSKYHEIYIPASINNINIILIDDNINNTKKTNIEEHNNDYEKEKYYEETIDRIFTKDNILFSVKTNYKFRISSVYLPHHIELFQVKNNEFFSTVARFYLPIVRSFYDGNNVFMTPSCISACMTLINIDYKYFAGSKDPIEIINKYRIRGFGTILNNTEINKLLKYSSLVPKWRKIYNLNIKSKSTVLKILGIFKLHKINNQTFNNLTYFNNHMLMNNDIYEIIKRKYNTKHNDLIYAFVCINEYGYIEPIKKWIIDASYDFL